MEPSVPNPSTNTERVERASGFVEAMLGREAAYHQHKEAAAYAGITLFAGIAGTAVVSKAWPPEWGTYTTTLAIGAATFLWVVILIFLRFQLTRRRWAALRVAACDRLLAAWLQVQPSDEALVLLPSAPRPPVSFCDKAANCIWGSKAAVRAVDTKESVYPGALVKELIAQEERGTNALKHERLILLTGWVFYIVLIVTALVRLHPDVAV